MDSIEEKNLIPLAQIEQDARKLKYGSLSVWLQIHNGHIVGVQGNKFKQTRYKAGQNSEATAQVLAKIKQMFDEKKSGNLTFTVTFKNGQIRRVYLQENIIKNYPV